MTVSPEPAEVEPVAAQLERANPLELPGVLRSLHATGRLTGTALVLDDASVTYDDFRQIASDLADFRLAVGKLGDMTQFWVGDLIVEGENLYGEDVYGLLKELDLPDGAQQDWSRVARNVTPGERRPELRWTHHRSVAGVKDPAERSRLLAHAVDEGLSSYEFKEYLRDLDKQVVAGNNDLTRGGEDSRTGSAVVVEAVVEAATLIYRTWRKLPDGDYVVPAELAAQLIAALGQE